MLKCWWPLQHFLEFWVFCGLPSEERSDVDALQRELQHKSQDQP